MSIASTNISRRSFVGAMSAAATLAILGIELPEAQASVPGSTFVYAIAGDPSSSPNPITTSDRYGLMTLKAVYSPLMTIMSDGTELFYLATGYEWDDAHLVLTMHLREGVKWHDGEPFTADDVVFTYNAKKNEPTADGYESLVFDDGTEVMVEAVDPLTVTFTFPFVNPAAVENVTTEMFIAPKHIYEGTTDWENSPFNEKGIGTGPYKLVEYLPGQYLAFAANEDYFLGAPNIESIIFQVVSNENTGMFAIQSGEVNAWIGTPAQIEQMAIEANGLKVTAYSEGRVAFFAINEKRVTDERVRKALLYSLDKKAIADAALLSDEYYVLPNTFLPRENGFYTDDVEKYDQDVEKAKALLAEAGVTNPTFKFAFSGSDSLQSAAAIMIQEQAKAAGITVELLGIDSSALNKAMRDPDNEYDMYFGGYIMGIDPSSYASLFQSGAAYCYPHWEHPEIDDLFAAGIAETDDAARHEIYADLQRAIANTGSFYPLYTNMRLIVTSGNVEGLEEARLVPIYTFEDYSKLKLA